MSCGTEKFIIDKTLDNEFIFTIKDTESTLPIVIDPADTFDTKIIKLDTNTEEIINTTTSIEDANSGKIKVSILAVDSASLVSERGSKADRYYLKPTYRMIVNGETASEGKIKFEISNVYVR